MVRSERVNFLKKYIMRNKKNIVIGLLSMILFSLITTPLSLIIGRTVDMLSSTNRSYIQLLQFILVILSIHVISILLSYIYQMCFSKVQQRINKEIKADLLKIVFNAPLSILEKFDKGYLVSRIDESQQISSLLSPVNLSSLIGIFNIFFSFILMFIVNSKLALVSMLIIPICFVISFKSTNKIQSGATEIQEASGKVSGSIFEDFNRIENIKILNIQKTRVKNLTNKMDKLFKRTICQTRYLISYLQLFSLTNSSITVFILGISGFLILRDEMTIGGYTTFSLYLSQMLPAIQGLSNISITLKPTIIIIDRVLELFLLPNENMGMKTIESINTISFSNVSFKYSNQSQLVLNRINLSIRLGDKVLIKGKNGTGKSTILKLILGIYNVTSGEIKINGILNTELDKINLRSKIGMVSQNIELYKGTILENILYGCETSTKENVFSIVEKCNLKNYFENFPKNLNTELSDLGNGVSGGQAQVIAFLRALIGEKELLIFDEATSNVDMKTRQLIFEVIEKNYFSKTILIVSHSDEKLPFINKTIQL
ncbi:ABC transporter ATP-binding protein [Candidatus Enterococcus mansonii]